MNAKEFLDPLPNIHLRIQALQAAGEMEEVERLEAYKKDALKCILAVPDSELSALLIERYVNGLSWEKVAERLGKDPDHVRKHLHGRALKILRSKMPETARNCPVLPC